VLQVGADGIVCDSNGRLEAELGITLRGRPFAEVLDPESNERKWARMLALASLPTSDEGDSVDSVDGDAGEEAWELVLRRGDALLEPRSFSAMWDDSSHVLWLVEHRADARMDDLRERVTGVNTELSNTQRELVKERSRLAYALETLESQYRETERLARTVQAQNAELERSNRALDEFAHAVSHDLRAPLRGISQYAGWLEADLGDALSGEGREHLHRLRDRAERMKAMITGALEYARAGREHVRPERVDLREMVAQVADLIDVPAGVAVEAAPGLPVLEAERAPLQQVLMNLVANAVRFAAGERPRVRVDARDAGDFVEVSVSDTGPGIPAAVRDRVWTLFHTGGGGTGIGLAVVKRVVESQGGRAWVDSPPGEGATFRFLWPRTPRGTGAEQANPKGVVDEQR
jgi:signal transduction histidine kinase